MEIEAMAEEGGGPETAADPTHAGMPDPSSIYDSLEAIVFSHVTFAYPGCPAVLRDVSFSIK